MLRKQVFAGFLALLLAAALVYGIGQLFAFRVEQGDVYAPYSTLRADPLGAKAIYEAFNTIPGLSARRSYRSIDHLKEAGPFTLIYVGISAETYWEREELAAFSSRITNGSRAVFAFLPADRMPKDRQAEERERVRKEKEKQTEKSASKKKAVDKDAVKGKKPDESKGKGDEGSRKEDEAVEPVFFSKVASAWGFEFAIQPGNRKASFTGKAVLEPGAGDLDPEVAWHSALYFAKMTPEWRTIYTCEGHPVVIERAWGRGAILLASDAYFMSNEALRNDRASRLLASLPGPPNILFDEQNHGIQENPNVATLVRRHHLGGVFAALLVIASLFLWQNMIRFLPPYPSETGADDVIGRHDLAHGFVSLLRRSIPPKELIETCIAEWRKSFGGDAAASARMAEATLLVANAGVKDSAAAYRAISTHLSYKHTPSTHRNL